MVLEPIMARLIDIASFAPSASAGAEGRIAAPLLRLSLLLIGPWAA
jgi:hypothetical protein